MIPSSLRRVLREPGSYVVAIALLFPLAIGLLIAKDGVDVPAYDDWARFPLLVKLNTGTLSWGDLLSPFNEHRMLPSNIVFLLVARLTSWNVKYEMAVTLVVTCVTLLNLGLLSRATLGGGNIRHRVALLLTSMLLFGPIQSDNWLWANQTAIVISIACTTGCVLLAQSKLPTKARLGLCLVLAGVATFSFGNGLLCWIVMLPVLVVEATGRRAALASVLVWIVGMMATVAAFLSGYSRAHVPLGLAFENPVRAAAYLCRFLGNPLAHGTPVDSLIVALAIGALQCALFAAVCVYVVARRDLPLARRAVPWVAVGLFAALSGILVTLTRMSIEIPLASRYATTAVLMLIALLHLVPLVCEDAWSMGYLTGLVRRAIPVALAVVLIPLHVTTSMAGIENAERSREDRLAGKAALMFANLFVDDEMLNIAFELGPPDQINTLERLGCVRPGLVRGGIRSLTETRGAAGHGTPGGSCGMIEWADRTAAGGWAVSPLKDARADAVVLAYDDEAGQPKAFAVARVGIETSGPPQLAAHDAHRKARWTKVFPGKVPATATRIFAWALDTESGTICGLATPTGAESLSLPGPASPIDSIGVMTPTASGNVFSLRNSNTSGPADLSLQLGDPGDIPVAGDWDGDGRASVGVFRPRDVTFYLRNSNTPGLADLAVPYGENGDIPVVGDWDGDGVTTIGVYRPRDLTFYLRNSNTPGPADLAIPYGAEGDVPVVGDWNGDRVTTIGVYRPTDHVFYLRNTNSPGAADIVIPYGVTGDSPVVGDWDGNGTTTIGVYRTGEGAFYLRGRNHAGPVDFVARFGAYGRYARPGGVPIVGDWDGR